MALSPTTGRQLFISLFTSKLASSPQSHWTVYGNKGTEVVVRRASQTSPQGVAFQRLVEIVSTIPECARSEVFGLSLTAGEHPDVTTCHILRAIRKELEVFMPVDDLPRLIINVEELDDTQNNIEVAFAIDKILSVVSVFRQGQTRC